MTIPRLARLRLTGAATTAKVMARTSVFAAAVVAPAGGTEGDAGGVKSWQEDLPFCLADA